MLNTFIMFWKNSRILASPSQWINLIRAHVNDIHKLGVNRFNLKETINSDVINRLILYSYKNINNIFRSTVELVIIQNFLIINILVINLHNLFEIMYY